MDFLTKHRDTIKTYAKSCPICMLIFMACAIITDELGAWLVAYILVFATLVTSLLAQLTQDFTSENNKQTSESNNNSKI